MLTVIEMLSYKIEPPLLLTVNVVGTDATFIICEKAILVVWLAAWKLLRDTAPGTDEPFCCSDSEIDNGNLPPLGVVTVPLKATL